MSRPKFHAGIKKSQSGCRVRESCGRYGKKSELCSRLAAEVGRRMQTYGPMIPPKQDSDASRGVLAPNVRGIMLNGKFHKNEVSRPVTAEAARMALDIVGETSRTRAHACAQ